jgi:DNA repair exonuclease SbcCD ATPase subunit
MILFENVKWKNFLSTGNQFTEVQLNRSKTTLIIGENGSGKSTILDALCFALFNKPFRIIKKAQLLNSINKKNCEVEVNFVVGKSRFKVVRGMKPTRFEIYRNDELFNQDAAARDYQKFLEQQILKLNYKSFTQIVVLGSASFTPFMQLSSNARREIIEDLLDIKVFSTMNEVLKDKTADSKLKINKFENDLELVKSKAEVQKNYIKKLQDDKKKKTDQLEKDIKEQVLLVECLEKVILLEKKKIKDKDIVETKLTKVQTLREKLYNKKDKCAEEIKFYEDNDQCPTCDQKLDNETKDQHIKKNNNKIKECRNALDELLLQMKPLQTRFNEIIKSEELINDTYNEIHALESVIKRLRSEVKDDAVDDVDIEKERVRLKDIAKEGMTITKDRDNEIDEKYYLDVASILLKDTGIKTKIIRQYLPVMNRIINKYLQAMDFFVSFEIDESFVETIKSRHRDDFSYASFSEGEKQRIDLALMMAWRTIAKMKNSTNTNLLILDEVFDSSLDTSGTELLHQILGTLDNNSNTFVISHRDALFDKFRSVIKFEKHNNFSRIT